MTHRLYFFAEKAYLSTVRDHLTNPEADHDRSIVRGAICIVALASALEAISNSIFRDYSNLRHFDEFRAISKIETLLDMAGKSVDRGAKPLNRVVELVRLRNWLVHFKDPNIGLMNLDGEWIVDTVNRAPKIDPDVHLSSQNIRDLYDAVREVILLIANGLEIEESFEYLTNEDYEPFLLM